MGDESLQRTFKNVMSSNVYYQLDSVIFKVMLPITKTGLFVSVYANHTLTGVRRRDRRESLKLEFPNGIGVTGVTNVMK